MVNNAIWACQNLEVNYLSLEVRTSHLIGEPRYCRAPGVGFNAPTLASPKYLLRRMQ